jgi:hypothetical protein
MNRYPEGEAISVDSAGKEIIIILNTGKEAPWFWCQRGFLFEGVSNAESSVVRVDFCGGKRV